MQPFKTKQWLTPEAVFSVEYWGGSDVTGGRQEGSDPSLCTQYRTSEDFKGIQY